MHLLKITYFFINLSSSYFYSINNKDMSLGNLDSCHHTLSNNSLKNKKPCKFQCTSSFTRMHSLKISEFFLTNHHHNFYSISNKDMPSGNLDSSGHI